ncbi:MAG: GNAT family N-acetyltransferase [Anaerolineae bacterium]|nr:GNAT family N-acetyltransferase [Anaerolineae bacterium]
MAYNWGYTPPPEPVLRRLHLADVPRAHALSQAVGWKHTAADWERILIWGGRGCFCIARGDDLLATATSTPYGSDRAWIGMVLVHPDHRRQGYGTRITQAVIEYLQARGVRRLLLDASELGRPLYEKMGFRALYNVEIWEGRGSSYLGPRARPMRPADLPAVVALDAAAFGVTRGRIIRRLVADFPDLAWVDEDSSGAVAGFVLAQANAAGQAHIGPWTHRSPWGAEKLLQTALEALQGRPVRVDIPDLNAQATVFAHNHDLKYQRHCVRMILGSAPEPNEDLRLTFGVCSLATG